MKKMILSCIALVMAAGAMAQPREFNPENMAKRQAERIKTTCNLSDAQYKSVLELFTKEAKERKAQMDSIRNAGGDFRQSFDREKMRAQRAEQEKAIKAILTEEQVKAYDKMRAERRNRPGGHRNGNNGPRPAGN